MQNLKSKYEQKEMRVSNDLWDRLEEKLDQGPAKEQKPKIVWIRYAAVILLVIGLGGSFLMINYKSDINENQDLANQAGNQNLNPIEQSENNKVEKVNPINNNSETDNKKLAVENVNPSTPESINRENQITNNVSEKEIINKKEELISIPQPEEKLAQNEIQKPKERPKYITSSDLLFGVEIDKAKSETPKSAMGINTLKPKNDSDFPNPKRIKLFGITLYDKDSITTK